MEIFTSSARKMSWRKTFIDTYQEQKSWKNSKPAKYIGRHFVDRAIATLILPGGLYASAAFDYVSLWQTSEEPAKKMKNMSKLTTASGSAWPAGLTEKVWAMDVNKSNVLAFSHQSTVSVWDYLGTKHDRDIVGFPTSAKVQSVHFVNSDTLAIGYADTQSIMLLYDLRTSSAKASGKIQPSKGSITSAECIRHDGLDVIAACKRGVVQWDLRTLNIVQEYPHGKVVRCDINGGTVVAATSDPSVVTWDMNTKHRKVLRFHSTYVQSIAIDRHKIVSADASGKVIVTNRHTKQPVQTFEDHNGWVMGLDISDDRMITGCSGGRVIAYEF